MSFAELAVSIIAGVWALATWELNERRRFWKERAERSARAHSARRALQGAPRIKRP